MRLLHSNSIPFVFVHHLTSVNEKARNNPYKRLSHSAPKTIQPEAARFDGLHMQSALVKSIGLWLVNL